MANKAPSGSGTAAPSLNVYEKIAVIRLPSDKLTYEDADGNKRSVLVEELAGAIASAVSETVFADATGTHHEPHVFARHLYKQRNKNWISLCQESTTSMGMSDKFRRRTPNQFPMLDIIKKRHQNGKRR